MEWMKIVGSFLGLFLLWWAFMSVPFWADMADAYRRKKHRAAQQAAASAKFQ